MSVKFKKGKLLKQDEQQNKEQNRGFWVIGIIASLLAAKEFYRSDIPFGALKISASVFINMLIITWGLYAFFMVFAESNDLISERICNLFLYMGRLIFGLGSLMIFYLMIVLFILGNMDKFNNILLILSPMIFSYVYIVYRKIQTIHFNRNLLFKFNFIIILTNILSFLWAIGAAFYLAGINSTAFNALINKYLTPVQFLPIPTFLIGLGWFILYVYKNNSEKKST